MEVIDRTIYKLECTHCGANESAELLDSGSTLVGSQAAFALFHTEWICGGKQKPKLTSADCKACGKSVIIVDLIA